MAPPVQSRERTPDYERWRAERRQDVFWGLPGDEGGKLRWENDHDIMSTLDAAR